MANATLPAMKRGDTVSFTAQLNLPTGTWVVTAQAKMPPAGNTAAFKEDLVVGSVTPLVGVTGYNFACLIESAGPTWGWPRGTVNIDLLYTEAGGATGHSPTFDLPVVQEVTDAD